MNEDIIKGKWRQLRGRIQARWGDLTDDDLDVAEGSAKYLSGRIQERYGIARDEADAQIRAFDEEL